MFGQNLSEEKKQVVEEVKKTVPVLYKAIYDLAKDQNESELKKLMDEYMSVDVFHNEFTPCGQLAFENNREAVLFLIDKFNANLNDAVFAAAKGECRELVDDLIAKGASLNDALYGAAQTGNIDFIHYLIARGACLDYAVAGAAQAGNKKLVKNFLARDASLDTAVWGAAAGGDLELVHYLLGRGASLQYALLGAASEKQIPLLTYLIDQIPCVTSKEQGEYLSAVVYGLALTGDVDLVQDWIDKGFSKDAAVEGLARRGQIQAVEALLDQKASVNQAVRGAAAGGHEKFVKYLLEQKVKAVDLAIALDYAVQGAAQSGNLNLVKELIAKGAHIRNALGYAAHYGHIKIVNYLITQNHNDVPYPILGSAARGGHQALVEYLFKKNDGIAEASLFRGSAIAGAAKNKNMKYVEHLINDMGFHEALVFNTFGPFHNRIFFSAVLGAWEHLKSKQSTLFLLSEFKSEKFRKNFLLEAKKHFPNINVDAELLETRQICSYKQKAHMSFNQGLACIQPDIHGLFSFISQTSHENHLNAQTWLIVASYLFPLYGTEAEKVRREIKRENVINDVQTYLCTLSYFSQAAKKAKQFIEDCTTAKSKKMQETINKVGNTDGETPEEKGLFTVVSKYQSKR